MAEQNGTMPAWLVCDGIIAKARDELLSQAISVMHEQLDKKRISLEGELTVVDEANSEREKDRFLLSQLVKEHANIEKKFSSYLEEAKISKQDANRMQELERFLLELRQIMLLSDYAKACESWLVEVEKALSEKAPERILASTIKKEPQQRREILEYLLKNKALAKDRIFTEEDKEIINKALNIAQHF